MTLRLIDGKLLRALLAALPLIVGSCGFSEPDVQCQRAGAHLVDCCPDYAIQMVTCDQLTATASRCVLASSCAALSDNGFCDAASIDSLEATLCP